MGACESTWAATATGRSRPNALRVGATYKFTVILPFPWMELNVKKSYSLRRGVSYCQVVRMSCRYLHTGSAASGEVRISGAAAGPWGHARKCAAVAGKLRPCDAIHGGVSASMRGFDGHTTITLDEACAS